MKRVFWIFICIIVLFSFASCVDKNSARYTIGSDMIEVLNSYKNGNIEAKNAGEQMEKLSEKAKAESEMVKDDFDESHKLIMLSLYADGTYTDLYFNETMSISDINECIKNIEKEMN